MTPAAHSVRGRRHPFALASVLVAGMLLSPAADARSAGHPRCPPAGAHVIAGDALVRVYSTPRAGATRERTEACTVRRGTRMTLLFPNRFGLHGSLGRLAFAGSVVAYVESFFGVDSGSLSITVVDVATRRVLRSVPDVGKWVDAGILGSEGVEDLLVGPAGSVAWIAGRSSGRGASTTYAVHLAAVSRAATLLDEGPDIAPTSLRLSKGTLSWWHAGVMRTASAQ